MKPTIFDRFNIWNFRNRSAIQLANELGMKLSVGIPLTDALESLAPDGMNKGEEQALLDASSKLKVGMNCAEIFIDKRINLKKRDRYVLSLPIDDKQKGKILKTFSNPERLSNKEFISSINFLIMKGNIFYICLLSLWLFVIPAFLEINFSFGSDNGMPMLLKMINDFVKSIYFSNTAITLVASLVFFNIILYFIASFIFNTQKHRENLELLDLLINLDKNDQWKYIKMLSNKFCFPKSYKTFNIISDDIIEGKDLQGDLEKLGLPPLMRWLIQLDLINPDNESLKEGLVLFDSELKYKTLWYSRLIDLIMLVFQSTVLFLVSYYLFGSISFLVTQAM